MPLLRQRVSWIALLPIAWLQLSIATHQFDHVADYIEDRCHVCVQLERVGAAVDEAAVRAPLPTVDVPWSKAPAKPVNGEILRNFDSRAPPEL